jgi:uncharacterized protein YaaN involved in tellurite resistance
LKNARIRKRRENEMMFDERLATRISGFLMKELSAHLDNMLVELKNQTELIKETNKLLEEFIEELKGD